MSLQSQSVRVGGGSRDVIRDDLVTCHRFTRVKGSSRLYSLHISLYSPRLGSSKNHKSPTKQIEKDASDSLD